jgi:4'-phosphopantetheinyl transferase
LGKIIDRSQEAKGLAANSSLSSLDSVMTIHLRDHVDCWCISTDELSREDESSAEALLSPEERARTDSFYFEYDRRSYLAAHAALRLLLARYTGESAESLTIQKDANGRPMLENSKLHINLSHSGNAVLIALSSAAPVGVDVEKIRGIPDVMAIARSHFSVAEVDAIIRLPPPQRATAFLVIWTRKEAFVKAIGRGLSFPLQTFGTGHPHQPPHLTGQDGEILAGWTMADLRPDKHHLAAVAIHRPNMPINCRRADWQWLLRGRSTRRTHSDLASGG